MATVYTKFDLSDSNLAAHETATLEIEFKDKVTHLTESSFNLKGVTITGFELRADGKGCTLTVSPIPDYNGAASIVLRTGRFYNEADNSQGTGNRIAFNVDTRAPESPAITFEDPGADGVYNAAEVGPDGTVMAIIKVPAGTEVGDTLTVNGANYTVTQDIINYGGSIQVKPGATVTAQITDKAGNPGTSATNTAAPADTTGPDNTTTQLVVDDVTTDNTINLAESNAAVTVTGKASGEFVAGDEVTLTINGNTYTGNVDATGKYSIEVQGADLAADADTTIDASITATDPSGNKGVITATKVYAVDTTVSAPTVVITEDANNDGVITYLENQNDKDNIDFTVSVANDTQVGDILTINGNKITVTQDIINNGYQGSLPAVDGQSIEVSATITDKVGNVSQIAKDNALIDLTIPDAAPIFLSHLGYNLNATQGPTDHRGKFGGKYGNDVNYTTTEINDFIYIGYRGLDSRGNPIKSHLDGDFERDCGDGNVVWKMETYAGHDFVQIREDQNAYTVAKLGTGNDTYYVQGKLDANLGKAKHDSSARSYIYTEEGDDAVVIGGNGNGKVTGWGIDGGRIFTGSGNDNVKVYGEVDDGAVIDLGAGHNDYADPNDISAASTIDKEGDSNFLSITHNLGNVSSYDYGLVFGGLGNDTVTVGTSVRGVSVINLGDGDNRVDIGCDLVHSAKIITGNGNDILNIGKSMWDKSTVDLGSGNDVVNIKHNLHHQASIDLGAGDDSITLHNMCNTSQINAGTGNDTVVVNSMYYKSNVNLGDGNDNMSINSMTGHSKINAGSGDDTVTFTGGRLCGSISGGEGNDILVLDFHDNSKLVNKWACQHETNASTADVNGFEVVQLKGQNVIDVRFADLVRDTDRDGALFIQGNEHSKVDLGSTNWNSDTSYKASMRDATGGHWMKASSTEVDGITYDIYHHSYANDNTNDVYIEQGVVVI